jgi:colanic acid/amylovoran biosynthesis glycosyltransferase
MELAQMASVARAAGPFDVILCHFGHVALEVDRLRELGAISGKLVTVFHAYDLTVLLRERGEDAYEQLLRRGDLFLPISQHWRQRLIGLGCPPQRLAVHHMGIDTRRFPFAERRPDGDADVTLVSVARLVEKKGLEHGIRAVAALRDRDLPVRYTIAGDGPLRAQLEALTHELGLADVVKLLGPIDQDEVGRLLAKAQVLLAPSITANNGDQEGIPLSIMEGMALGMPVVSTWHSGISELVEDGVSGYLVPESDSETLADRIEILIAEPERRAEMGTAGRRIVERDFDVDRLNDQLADRLESLLSNSSAR